MRKAPAAGRSLRMQRCDLRSYLSAVWTLVKVVINFEPRPCTTAMMATEMPAAIRPYSMAVAPDSSFTNLISFVIVQLLRSTWLSERGPGACCVPDYPEPWSGHYAAALAAR